MIDRLTYIAVGWFAIAAIAAIAGCGRADPEVPRYDYSGSGGYTTAPLKDDAPANSTVATSDFPVAFVDADGNPIDLTQYRGHKKVVLVVLRGVPRSEKGGFCPTCLAQVSSLMANRDEFTRREAEVLVVFPGPSERVGEFLQKARNSASAPAGHPLQVLLDQECQVCERLGIRDDLAKPSTYVLDTRGNVVYAYVGETSTDRPSVKAILTQLDCTK